MPDVAGTWKDLTDNVNFMASNLTGQVRNIADVTTAVARGDLTRKITADAREILELKNTINIMVDQLSAVRSGSNARSARGGNGRKLGGQASVAWCRRNLERPHRQCEHTRRKPNEVRCVTSRTLRRRWQGRS